MSVSPAPQVARSGNPTTGGTLRFPLSATSSTRQAESEGAGAAASTAARGGGGDVPASSAQETPPTPAATRQLPSNAIMRLLLDMNMARGSSTDAPRRRISER